MSELRVSQSEVSEARLEIIVDRTDFTHDQLRRMEADLVETLWQTLVRLVPEGDLQAQSLARNRAYGEALDMPREEW
jgi:hypothetical protein